MSITQHGTLAIDDNDKPVMGGTSSVDNSTIVNSAYDPTTRRLLVDVSGGGLFSVLIPAGTVDGVNTVFVFASAPSIIVLDNQNTMNKTSSDGTPNWTGTTTITLQVAPTFNIYGF